MTLPARARTCFEGPFGEVLRATGPLAKANPFRWSTRYTDDETDLVMYPGRPWRDGRFISRDPFGEKGGRNLYAFVGNTLAIDPFGHAQLHYIDHPKWEQVDVNNPSGWLIREFLWVGHYLTFDSSDAAKLSGNRGVLMVKHRSVANVTDCRTGNQVQPVSHYWYFANRFLLNSDGSVARQDNPDAFTDGQFYLFTQVESFSMAGMFNRYSGSSGERLTKGNIHSTMELRVIPQDAFNGDGWDASPPPGYDDTNINGHELGRPYWGRSADSTPISWDTAAAYSVVITVDFNWDDCAAVCGGMTRWNYRVDPLLTERGQQRARYAGRQWSAADLVFQPSN